MYILLDRLCPAWKKEYPVDYKYRESSGVRKLRNTMQKLRKYIIEEK